MPGTVKSELLTYAYRSHKCDSQEKVCWMLYLPLDKSHFITGFDISVFDKSFFDFSLLDPSLFNCAGSSCTGASNVGFACTGFSRIGFSCVGDGALGCSRTVSYTHLGCGVV